MGQLGESDLRGILDLIGECEDASDLASFGSTLLGISRLVPGAVAFNQIDLARQTATTVKELPDPPGIDGVSEFARLAHQNPLVVHGRQGDPPLTISDILSARSFRALELYDVIFAPYGFQDQIAVHLLAPAQRVVGIAINRERRGFSQRDRTLLGLIAPGLSRAYRQVLERERSRELTRLLRRGLVESGTAVIVLGPEEEIQLIDERGESLLRAFCGPSGVGRLPATIREWLAGEEPDEMLQLAGEGGRQLSLRLLDSEADRSWRAILLDEWGPGPSPEQLRLLGLTGREAEVLAWVARGTGDTEIGRLLAISPRTVDKHLENAYRKLGVNSRAEAVARASARIRT